MRVCGGGRGGDGGCPLKLLYVLVSYLFVHACVHILVLFVYAFSM